MAVNAHKLGPGSLKLGATGSPQEFASQCTKVEIDPSTKEEDPIPVLSGDQYNEEGDFEGKLSGEFLQEYTVAGLVNWTWKNNGRVMPFEFKPRNDAELTYMGECVVRAVKVGGDVKKANTAEFEWALTKMPTVKEGTSTPPAGGSGA